MKSIKYALLGLLLATSAIAASATEIDGFDFVNGTPAAGTLQTWDFSFGGDGVMANDTFVYDLLFNPPPSAPVTYFAFATYGNALGAVSFSDASSFTYYGDVAPDGYSFTSTDPEVWGGGFVPGALYDLHLEGTFLVDGASVNGRAVDDLDTVAVPEPVSVSLMMAGLAGIVGTRRRRGKAVAQAAQAA
jgi:hypothetical protein